MTRTTSAAPTAHAFVGLRELLRMAHQGEDLRPLAEQLIEHLAANPSDAYALMDLSLILQMTGKRPLAMAMQAEALQVRRLFQAPAAPGVRPRLRLLALMVPGDLMANAPLECLLHGSDIALDMLYLPPDQPLPDALPDHDVLIVAAGESDRTRALLDALREALAGWPRPVLNAPERVLQLSRDRAAQLLSPLPGVSMPPTRRAPRDVLGAIARGEAEVAAHLGAGGFPILVRPLDSHAGRDLAKLDTPAALAAYLSAHDDEEFFISCFVDYRNADGLFRKYRVVMLEGRTYVCHVGISDHWMIHYLNAGMTDSADKRAEEADIMQRFDETFAVRHRDALERIQACLGLDYFGLDCAETPGGDLLIFEADTCMVVHDLDPADVFPYKQPQMRKVFAAFRTLLLNAAADSLGARGAGDDARESIPGGTPAR